MTPADAPPDPRLVEHSRHYTLVARAIEHLREHRTEQPSLDALARALHTSPAHLQRVFSAWAGLSPKRFLQHLTMEDLRKRLERDGDLLGAALDAGLSGTGRLHDLTLSCEGLTPGELKSGGAGVAIVHGHGPTPFGPAHVAWTPRGVCHLAFEDDGQPGKGQALEALRQAWPAATLRRDDARACRLLAEVFPGQPRPGRLHLVLRGTNFQIQVWRALMRTQPGEVLSYTGLARAIGREGAQRAVGSAVAANAVAWLIPCHRVIRGSGETGQYRWGPTRKVAMLGWEAARRGPAGPEAQEGCEEEQEEDGPGARSQRSTMA